jgi:hypothetical protein
MDDPETAIPYLEDAVAINPNLPLSRSNLAIAFAMAGRHEAARTQAVYLKELEYVNLEQLLETLEYYESLEEGMDESE